jgi:hypothetical protein
MFFQRIWYVAALSAATIASPLIPRQCDTCASCTDVESYTVNSTTQYTPDWQAVSGQACTSDNEDTCTVGESASVSLGVTVTEGGSLNFGDIASIATSVSFSYTTTTGESIGETCPKGGYVCGLIYQNQMVNITGQQILTYEGDCALAGTQESNNVYNFLAPIMIGDTPQVTFAACISNSSPNQNTSVGLQMCPGGL